jgi:hypothetical protein
VLAISEIKEIVPPKLKRVHHHPPEPAGDYEADTPGEFA